MKGWIAWNAFGAALLLPVFASAQGYTVRQDTVVPVVFEDQLSISRSRVGDRFYARVDRDRDLPDGTKLVGRVQSIRKASGSDPAYMDLQFTDLVLPGGSRMRVDALPIPLTDKYVRRDRNGRIVARSTDKKRETQVIGGAVAGFVIGSIFHKQVEGTIIGTVAGVILAETEGKKGQDIVIDRGQRMGALINRDLYVDTSRNGDIADDREDPTKNDDRYREDDREDRYNDRQDLIRIRYEDRDLQFEDKETPYRIGDTVMVPLLKTADQLDFRVEQVRDSVYYVDDDDNTLRLEQDNPDYRLNGSRGTMSRPLAVRDGVVFVPLEVFAKIRREKLTVNGNRIEGTTD